MVKKTYGKKINKAVKKAIGRYYRVTVSKVISLVGSANGIALSGNGEGYNLSGILTGTSTFQELGKQFALCKIRGVYIEAAPWSTAGGSGTGMMCLALQQAEEENNNGVFSQPNVMSLSSHQITKKYIPIASSWMPTNNMTGLTNLKLAFQAIQTFNTQINFTVLIKLYLTFKSSL